MASIQQAEPGPGEGPGEGQIGLSLHGDRLRVIETGPALRQALVDLIDGAQESLKLSYYIFAADGSGQLVLASLTAARGRGRSDGRRVGKERVRACRPRRPPYHYTNNTTTQATRPNTQQ